MLIRLTNVELDAIIDDEDEALVSPYRWFRNGQEKHQGYVVTKVPHPEGGLIPRSNSPYFRKRTTSLRLSRLLMGLEWGDKREVDHINHNKLDNRRSNLEIVTRAENGQNRIDGTGASRYRGVFWRADRQKWKACVELDGHAHHLGCFNSEEEAARVAAEWRAEHMPFSPEGRAPRPF
jgi:hypothetical protein